MDSNGTLSREEFNLFNWRTSGEEVQVQTGRQTGRQAVVVVVVVTEEVVVVVLFLP